MNKIVFFDLDGTVIDTIGDITDAMNKMLIKYNFQPITIEQMKKNIGGPSREIVKLSIAKEIS